jgi:hypothetical protein
MTVHQTEIEIQVLSDDRLARECPHHKRQSPQGPHSFSFLKWLNSDHKCDSAEDEFLVSKFNNDRAGFPLLWSQLDCYSWSVSIASHSCSSILPAAAELIGRMATAWPTKYVDLPEFSGGNCGACRGLLHFLTLIFLDADYMAGSQSTADKEGMPTELRDSVFNKLTANAVLLLFG